MKIGFIGFGNMAKAIISGLDRGFFLEIFSFDPAADRGKAEELGVAILKNNIEVIEASDIIVVAVKPQVLDTVIDEIKDTDFKNKILISIVAGKPTSTYSPLKNVKIVRTMPNTPALVKKGVTMILDNPALSKEDRKSVENIFRSVGEFYWINNEKLMDAVTALSGSGPAYFFTFIEALMMAGVRVGLPRDLALKLAIGTGEGSLALLREKMSPAELRDMVSSPGGTTIAALEVFERSGLRGIIIEGVRKAYERSIELGKKEG